MGYNDSSVGIGFIGFFESRAPCDAALRATQELIRMGIKEVKQHNELHKYLVNNQRLYYEK